MCSFRFSLARKPLPQNGHKCGRPGSYSGGGPPVPAAAAAAATDGKDGGPETEAAAVDELGIGATGGLEAAAAAAAAAAALKSRIRLCQGPADAADGPAPLAGEGPIEVLTELLLLPSPSSDPSRSEGASPS